MESAHALECAVPNFFRQVLWVQLTVSGVFEGMNWGGLKKRSLFAGL